MGKPLGSSGQDSENNTIRVEVNFFNDETTLIPSYNIGYDSTLQKLTVSEIIADALTKTNSYEHDITSLNPEEIKNYISDFIKIRNLKYDDAYLNKLFQCIEDHPCVNSNSYTH